MPPFDPRQVVFEPSVASYFATLGCSILLLLLARFIKRGRVLLLCWAVCIALTTPLLFNIDTAVWGAYPTIDKEGSLLFYQDGVHLRIFQPQSFSDPAHRLIGFHMGHLWLSQFFDLFVQPFGAFNLQALFNIAMSWYCTYLLLVTLKAQKAYAWLLASMFALHAHVFRDIQFYTIEKSALYGLPLFWWALHRCKEGDRRMIVLLPLIFTVTSWINLYWGILCSLLCAVLLPVYWYRRKENRRVLLRAIALCIGCGMGIGFYQWLLMTNGPSFGSAELFLERAALDHLSLWPFSWNRLSWHASFPPILILLLGWSVYTRKLQYVYLLPAIVFFCLSIGPWLATGIPNPAYRALVIVPGLWRFAKPEIFFFISFLSLLCAIHRLHFSRRNIVILGILTLGQWVFSVRNTEEYPHFSTFIPSNLPKNWEEGIFKPTK